MGLHLNKIATEKNAFINELFSNAPHKNAYITGKYKTRARTLHQIFLPIYILNTYRDDNKFSTFYLTRIVSIAIETESALFMGFYNLGMASLRSLLEAATMFLYYECHPIEYRLHLSSKHQLSSVEYRSFLYSYPDSQKIHHLNNANFEVLWSELCQFSHSDYKAVANITFVQDLHSIFSHNERTWQKSINLIKKTIITTVILLFVVNSEWGKNIEKAYYDEIFNLFTPPQKKSVREAFALV